MSTVAWPFRELPREELAASGILMACRRAGLRFTARRQPAARTQARFVVETPAVRMEVACDAAAWYAGRFPALRDVAWDVLVDQQGAEHFVADDATVTFVDPQLQDAVVTFAGLDSERAPTLSDGTSVALRLDHGDAWVRSARLTAAHPPAQAASTLLTMLPVHVDLRLGQVHMATRTLRRLAPGSIVVLNALEPRGCVAGRPAFEFTFTQTEISLMSAFDFLDDEADNRLATDARLAPGEAPAAIQEHGRRTIDAVPVGVEIILCRLSRTVAQLGDLSAGATMELPDEAWKCVELRANGVQVATGELVQIGGQVGVMLHEAAKIQ